jgi:cob(I)alamin adenosyltransferase
MSATTAKKSMLYTRTGDQGETSLYSGDRCSKADERFDALGATDELCAHLGLARQHCIDDARDQVVTLIPLLEYIMGRLLDAGSSIATPVSSASARKVRMFVPK